MQVGWIWVKQGLAKVAPLSMGSPDGGHVGRLGVGGEVEDIGVPAGGQHYRMTGVAGHLAGDQVAHHDPDGLAVLDHHIEHLATGVELHRPGLDLAHQRLIRPEQELLPGLAPGVEGAGYLGPAEGPGVEQTAVLSGEGDPLRGRLVDDVEGEVGEPIDIGLPASIVPTLHRVVEQPLDRVPVVLVVLGRVDPTLGRYGVRPARRVVEGEHLDLVSELGQRRGRRGAGEPGAHDEDLELPLVGWVDQLDRELVVLPLVGDRPRRDPGVELDGHLLIPRNRRERREA